ncbi:unnamed protein product [Closterium sp. NIES-53]
MVLEVLDSSGNLVARRLSRHSSFMSGLFTEGVLVVEDMFLEVLDNSGASESAAALSASASAATGASESAASAETLHTFTLESGTSRCFFRDCTIVTPLAAPVLVSLADPSWGPVVARVSTVLPCLAVPSGSLSSLHLPSFSTILVRNKAFRMYGLIPLSLEGSVWRSCVAPHSSSFPLIIAPLKTLHMDVWGPGPVRGTDQERYILLVVDDYTHYTTVFPLRSKADVHCVLIPWIRATRHQLREWFRRDLPVLRLHSDRGSEFSSGLLSEFCRDEGIVQSFTILASPQKNGIDKRRIGLIMEVARTSIIHAAAPHFLWPFAARYAAHQLNLWPRVSLPETSPTLRWTGEVGDTSAFRVWGELSFVRDATASKLSPHTLCCAFLGFPTDAPPWQFYYPCSHCVFSSQDVTFDESGPAPSGVSHVDPPPLVEPLVISSDTFGPDEGVDTAADNRVTTRRSPRLENPPGFPPRPSSPPLHPVAVDAGVAGGGDTGGKDAGGAGPGGAETGGEGSGGADSGGADSGGDASPSGGGAVGAPAAGPGVGQQQPPSTGGIGGAGGAGAAGAGGVGAAGAGGARTRDAGAAGGGGAGAAGAGGAGSAGTGGAGAAGARGAAGAGGAGTAGTGGASAGGTRAADGTGTGPRGPFFYPQPVNGSSRSLAPVDRVISAQLQSSLPPPASALRHVLSLPSSTGLTPPLLCPPSAPSQTQLLPGSPLPATSPYTELSDSLTERRESESHASTPVRARCVACLGPPAVPSTHVMALRPSSVP